MREKGKDRTLNMYDTALVPFEGKAILATFMLSDPLNRNHTDIHTIQAHLDGGPARSRDPRDPDVRCGLQITSRDRRLLDCHARGSI